MPRRRIRRRLGLEANPLCRLSDRVQGLILLLCMLVALVGAPLAGVAAGAAVDHMGLRAERADAHTLRQVTATLVAGSKKTTGLYGDTVYWAPARWRAPDGATSSGILQGVPADAAIGAHLRIWVDPKGRQTDPPRTHEETIVGASVAAITIPMIAILVVAYLYSGVLALLDRGRMRRWAREWAATEPGWSGRAPRP